MTQALTQRRYTEEDKRLALRELAYCGGNYSLASSRLLELRGERVPPETMRTWLRHDDMRALYTEIHAEVSTSLDRRLAEDQEAVGLATTPVILKAIGITNDQLDAGELKDASTAARNLATVMGIAVDKSRLLRDKPTEIRENRQASDIIRKLKASGALNAIDVEHEDITDADSV